VNIRLVDDQFDTEKTGSENDRKCDKSSFTKDRINVIFFEISKRLKKSDYEQKEIASIFEERGKRFLSTEFSGKNGLKNQIFEFFGSLFFERVGRTEPIDFVDLGSVFGSFEEGFKEGTNGENVSSRSASCHCDDFFLLFHLVEIC
jgi:hypothetical protein